MAEKRVFKSKRKLSGGGQVTYRKWSEWKAGDVAVLRFMDSKIDSYSKPNYRCEVIDAHFADGSGEGLIGKNLCLNSTGMLDKAMKEINAGDLFQLEYNGTATIEKGPYKGKSSHTMDIDLVSEDDGDESAERPEAEETEDDDFL